MNRGGGNTPSGNITIDDVVKFIHDDLAGTPLESMFPYTTWDEIPNYNSVEGNQVCKTTSISDYMYPYILSSFHHIIGMKQDNPN